ncbi:hypothetical protein [Vibrio crassostreae]|uniref:hypothetical protein n=1 Tax=Vibrio crassostreae TaxID=246167 RepID=UPI001B30661C|nr:hypothetical protein [Vibrio crassostreae]
MKEFEVTLSIKPRIKIHNPEKLEGVVCNNTTGWCDSFTTHGSIEDFIDEFSLQAHMTHRSFERVDGRYTYVMFIEGIGRFYDYNEGWFKLADKENIEEFGQIEFFFDNDFDLEVDWSAKEVA